jgi:hypothetical protein
MEMRGVMTFRRFGEHPNDNAKEAGEFGHGVKEHPASDERRLIWSGIDRKLVRRATINFA